MRKALIVSEEIVLDFVKQNPGKPATEIAFGVKVLPQYVRNMLNLLKAKGLLYNTKAYEERETFGVKKRHQVCKWYAKQS